MEAISFRNVDTRLHVGTVSKTSFKLRPIYHWERTLIPTEQEAG